jgi:hypothetical protein
MPTSSRTFVIVTVVEGVDPIVSNHGAEAVARLPAASATATVKE